MRGCVRPLQSVTLKIDESCSQFFFMFLTGNNLPTLTMPKKSCTHGPKIHSKKGKMSARCPSKKQARARAMKVIKSFRAKHRSK